MSSVSLRRFAAVLIALAALGGLLLVGADRAAAQGGDAPEVYAFPNAPGAITLQWAHDGEGVWGYRIEQESPFGFTSAGIDMRAYTVTGLRAATTYRYRVCAVFDWHEACSEYASVTTLSPPPPPTPKPAPQKPQPAPAPPPPKKYIKCLGKVKPKVFESVAMPGQFMYWSYLAPVTVDEERKAASFYLGKGLTAETNKGCTPGNGPGSGYVSFQLKALPGYYLRARGDQIWFERDDGSEQFKRDATFTRNVHGDTYTFGAAYRSGEFITANGIQLRVEKADGSQEFAQRSLWRQGPGL
jgi:hypothetical protein